MPNFVLSKKDRELLQAVVTKVGLLPPKLFPPEEGRPPSSPGVYVARPTTNIPALIPAGTTDLSDTLDIPGKGEADIYQILDGDGLAGTGADHVNTIQALDEVTQEIWNLSGNDLGTDDWIVIQQDKFGRWIVPRDAGFTEYKHKYIMMKEQIAPNGNAEAYKLRWTGSAWVRDTKFFNALKIHPTDNTFIYNVQNAGQTRDIFETEDAGERLEIVDGTNFTLADYTVQFVCESFYNDIVIIAGGPTFTISSASNPFTAFDAGLQLVIDSGTDFTPGVYGIISVTDGIAEVVSGMGTVGATGGVGHIIPIAKVSAATGTVGSTAGIGFLGAIDVFETQGIYRAFGLEDIGDPLLHLVIDGSDNTKITNTGDPFVAGDVDKKVLIDASAGTSEDFLGGTYQVISVAGGAATLDRQVGNTSATEGTGVILRTDASIGIAEFHPDSSRWEIVTLLNIAKIVRATLAEDIVPADTTVSVIDLESMDGGQAILPDVVVSSYTDLDLVGGTDDTITSDAQAFTDNDVNLAITIDSGCSLDAGTYLITAVNGSGEATLDRPATDPAIGTGSGSGNFDCNGSTKKPLVVNNDGYATKAGTVILMVWDEENDAYQLLGEPVTVYSEVSGLLTEDITGTASTFEIDNVKVISGVSPLNVAASTSETLTVTNVFDMSGDNNGLVHAKFNITSGNWEGGQMECPA